jgi:hypothetical protein|tara:strand:+ start:262 stop:606 length:345 start_codon:yes stop_codon:yes gene_type:complete
MKCFNCGATKSFEKIAGDVDVQDLVASSSTDSPSHKCKCGSYAYGTKQKTSYVFTVTYYEESICKGEVTVQARNEAEAKRILVNSNYTGLEEKSRKPESSYDFRYDEPVHMEAE